MSVDMSPVLLNALHETVACPECLRYVEFHTNTGSVAGYMGQAAYGSATQVPEGWYRYSVLTTCSSRPAGGEEHWTEYDHQIVAYTTMRSTDGFPPEDLYCTMDLDSLLVSGRFGLIGERDVQFGASSLDDDWRAVCGILPELGVIGLVDGLTGRSR